MILSSRCVPRCFEMICDLCDSIRICDMNVIQCYTLSFYFFRQPRHTHSFSTCNSLKFFLLLFIILFFYCFDCLRHAAAHICVFCFYFFLWLPDWAFMLAKYTFFIVICRSLSDHRTNSICFSFLSLLFVFLLVLLVFSLLLLVVVVVFWVKSFM